MFTREQFFDVFWQYHEAVWPAQVVLACLAIAIVVLLLRLRPWSGVAVSAVLTILWVWPAVAYHLLCFAPINPLTYAFAVLSIVGLEPFAWRDLVQRQLDFGSPTRG